MIRANWCNLGLFLTGAMIGSLFAALGNTRCSLAQCYASGAIVWFWTALLSCGKFLLLLLLLANTQVGALLIPPLFGLQGMLLGIAFSASFLSTGIHGILSLALLFVFRLILVLPYGFVLGAWSVSRSLSPTESHPVSAVAVLTLVVLLVSALGECTLARHFSWIYFHSVGVSWHEDVFGCLSALPRN